MGVGQRTERAVELSWLVEGEALFWPWRASLSYIGTPRTLLFPGAGGTFRKETVGFEVPNSGPGGRRKQEVGGMGKGYI